MNSYLLYKDTDYLTEAPYFDAPCIIQDLGLRTLFMAAAKEVVYEEGLVKNVKKEDPFLLDTMKKIMMIPLQNGEQITYRQEILKDCLKDEAFIRSLYALCSETLNRWKALGRNVTDKYSQRNPVASLLNDLHVLHLFSWGLSEMKKLLEEHLPNLKSEGLRTLYERLCKEYPEELESYIQKVLTDVSFYTEGLDEEKENLQPTVLKPHIVFGCSLEDGLKLSNLTLTEVSSVTKRFYKAGGTMDKIQEFKKSRIPDSFSTSQRQAVSEQAGQLEFQMVSYVVSGLSPFMTAFNSFFDSLHRQSAFYLGAVNMVHQIKRFTPDYCFPRVCDRDCLRFEELRELVMCMEQRVNAVGNTCRMDHKMLLIVTGANQGGKSTFLRSIGIAQIMMQCGLMVAANSYESGIFPHFFTHFTRREDSEMNSGRLDEELRRMNQIIENLGDHALILLNESFATTTEKEGSVIAYDIIKALNEAGVKILTVTHLLSFARQVYSESQDNPESDVEFFCAERMENGTRTFKMIQHAPLLTSFGLDLYEDIVEKNKTSNA